MCDTIKYVTKMEMIIKGVYICSSWRSPIFSYLPKFTPVTKHKNIYLVTCWNNSKHNFSKLSVQSYAISVHSLINLLAHYMGVQLKACVWWWACLLSDCKLITCLVGRGFAGNQLFPPNSCIKVVALSYYSSDMLRSQESELLCPRLNLENLWTSPKCTNSRPYQAC